MSTLLNLYRKGVISGVEESRENLVSLCLGLDDFPYRVHCGSEFWSFDIAERQEPPNGVPRGANCLESGLGHACVKSAFLALFTCFLGLLSKNGWMLCVLCNAMRKEEVIHSMP